MRQLRMLFLGDDGKLTYTDVIRLAATILVFSCVYRYIWHGDFDQMTFLPACSAGIGGDGFRKLTALIGNQQRSKKKTKELPQRNKVGY